MISLSKITFSTTIFWAYENKTKKINLKLIMKSIISRFLVFPDLNLSLKKCQIPFFEKFFTDNRKGLLNCRSLYWRIGVNIEVLCVPAEFNFKLMSVALLFRVKTNGQFPLMKESQVKHSESYICSVNNISWHFQLNLATLHPKRILSF